MLDPGENRKEFLSLLHIAEHWIKLNGRFVLFTGQVARRRFPGEGAVAQAFQSILSWSAGNVERLENLFVFLSVHGCELGVGPRDEDALFAHADLLRILSQGVEARRVYVFLSACHSKALADVLREQQRSGALDGARVDEIVVFSDTENAQSDSSYRQQFFPAIEKYFAYVRRMRSSLSRFHRKQALAYIEKQRFELGLPGFHVEVVDLRQPEGNNETQPIYAEAARAPFVDEPWVYFRTRTPLALQVQGEDAEARYRRICSRLLDSRQAAYGEGALSSGVPAELIPFEEGGFASSEARQTHSWRSSLRVAEAIASTCASPSEVWMYGSVPAQAQSCSPP